MLLLLTDTDVDIERRLLLYKERLFVYYVAAVAYLFTVTRTPPHHVPIMSESVTVEICRGFVFISGLFVFATHVFTVAYFYCVVSSDTL